MLIDLSLLMAYTAWERQEWNEWFRQHGEQTLKILVGSHGDGRFETVGDLVRHMFSAEKRYIERLSGKPLTDTACISKDNVEVLFQFGQQSRRELMEFVETFPAQEWDIPNDYKILDRSLRATPKKIVIHILVHEIRHWAQIATLLRLNGLTCEFHDFLFSPVTDTESRPE